MITTIIWERCLGGFKTQVTPEGGTIQCASGKINSPGFAQLHGIGLNARGVSKKLFDV